MLQKSKNVPLEDSKISSEHSSPLSDNVGKQKSGAGAVRRGIASCARLTPERRRHAVIKRIPLDTRLIYDIVELPSRCTLQNDYQTQVARAGFGRAFWILPNS